MYNETIEMPRVAIEAGSQIEFQKQCDVLIKRNYEMVNSYFDYFISERDGFCGNWSALFEKEW